MGRSVAILQRVECLPNLVPLVLSQPAYVVGIALRPIPRRDLLLYEFNFCFVVQRPLVLLTNPVNYLVPNRIRANRGGFRRRGRLLVRNHPVLVRVKPEMRCERFRKILVRAIRCATLDGIDTVYQADQAIRRSPRYATRSQAQIEWVVLEEALVIVKVGVCEVAVYIRVLDVLIL